MVWKIVLESALLFCLGFFLASGKLNEWIDDILIWLKIKEKTKDIKRQKP